MFKSIDKNGNKKIEGDEFFWGLNAFGITLSQQEASDVLKAFDKNKDGHISLDEFIRALRGDVNAFRRGIIKKAYEKLDVNNDGTVRLDDIAKLYDVSKNPEVVSGRKDPKEVYMEFMKQWDTQVADGIVTFDEFLDYFTYISASIDSDQYFAEMMKFAWKIDI